MDLIENVNTNFEDKTVEIDTGDEVLVMIPTDALFLAELLIEKSLNLL